MSQITLTDAAREFGMNLDEIENFVNDEGSVTAGAYGEISVSGAHLLRVLVRSEKQRANKAPSKIETLERVLDVH